MKEDRQVVTMPPKTDWYTHLFRDTEGVNHAVITLSRNRRRTKRLRVTCGLLVGTMQRKQSNLFGFYGITCNKCLHNYDAMDRLLKEAT